MSIDPAVQAAAEAIRAANGLDDDVIVWQRMAVAAVAAARPIIVAEVRRTLLWECPECAFGFDRMHTDEGGGYSCPVCELAEVRERIAADIEAEADPNVVGDYGMGHNAGTYQAASIARGES